MSIGAVLDTLSTHFAVTNPSGNVTTSSFTQPIPKTSIPSGDGVIAWGNGGSISSNGILLVPFGVGSDNTAFLMNVFGWRPLLGLSQQGTAGLLNLWVPVLLATYTGVTLDSALPGVANTQEGVTQYFCSAMTLGIGNSGISVEVVSPGHAAHQIAHTVLDGKGFRFLEVQFSTNSSATSCNAFYARI